MRDPRTSRSHLTATVATLKGPCPKCKGEQYLIRVRDGAVSIHDGNNGARPHEYADLYLYVRAVKEAGFGYLLSPFLHQLPGTVCGACGFPIVFVHTRKNRLMPLNRVGAQIGDSHFATCPKAQEFRKPKEVKDDPRT